MIFCQKTQHFSLVSLYFNVFKLLSHFISPEVLLL